MKPKLISVIVPIYNTETYLEKCINSIINQTYKNLEIILIDDGSIDNSGEICEYYRKKDERIIVIHQANEGLSCARNKGLDVATGDLISFVDSDDYLENNMLESLKKNMDKYNSEISICNYYLVKNESKKKVINDNIGEFVSIDKEKFNNINNKYGLLTVYAWNKLYKKELFDNIRYPNGKIYEDSYILCDILVKARKVSYCLNPLYNYVYRKESISHLFSINHFNKIDSFNRKIRFLNSMEYYDLSLKERNKKMDILLLNLSKMKRYKIKDKETFNKYYQELVDTNKEVKWRGATKYNKFYKVFRKPSISILAFMLKVRDLIKK